VRTRRVEDQHAEADERVAEENCDGEEHHDEHDVDFLAEGFVGQGDGEVWVVRVSNCESKREEG
jgi:hypothetical protein